MCMSQRSKLRLKRNVCPKMSRHHALGIEAVYRRKFLAEKKFAQPALKYRQVGRRIIQIVYLIHDGSERETVATA